MRGSGDVTYPKGSYVIFEPKKTSRNNSDVIIDIDGKKEFIRYRKEDERIFAITLNPEYTNQQLAEPPTIYAKAIECRINV